MGFGHRVYKNGDSRVPTMRKALEDISAHVGENKWLEIYAELEDEMRKRRICRTWISRPAPPTS